MSKGDDDARFQACYDDFDAMFDVVYGANLAMRIIYLVLLTYTICKHKQIVKTSTCLLISWALGSILWCILYL